MIRRNILRIILYSFLCMLAFATLGFVVLLNGTTPEPPPSYPTPSRLSWPIQSIDTMKYSRDRARERLSDASSDADIDAQVAAIAASGANFVALGTPYDEEFAPYLKRWVDAARRHRLHVWFRGNLSGWEGWFDYPRINAEEHTAKIDTFIRNHPGLFADGDIFSSCPECENGSLGDPRMTGDADGYRRFLVQEYAVTRNAFAVIGKKVDSQYFSMNADVARLVMDPVTTRSLGGVVTVDHYVKDPSQLAKDIDDLARQSQGKVMLGEFGAPIPDIHGEMTLQQQSQWLQSALKGLAQTDKLVGVNYWTNTGSSTALWDNGQARPAEEGLKRSFRPTVVYGFIQDELGHPIAHVAVKTKEAQSVTDNNGYFILRSFEGVPTRLFISAPGFNQSVVMLRSPMQSLSIKLNSKNSDTLFRLRRFMKENIVDR